MKHFSKNVGTFLAGNPPTPFPILQAIVNLVQRLERLGKSERLGLVSSRKPRRLVSVSSRTKFSMSWSRLGLGHLGLVSRLGLGVKGLVDISAHGSQ